MRNTQTPCTIHKRCTHTHTLTHKHIAACKSSREHNKSLLFDPATFFPYSLAFIWKQLIILDSSSLAYTANIALLVSGAEAPPSGEICDIHHRLTGNRKTWLNIDIIFFKYSQQITLVRVVGPYLSHLYPSICLLQHTEPRKKIIKL